MQRIYITFIFVLILPFSFFGQKPEKLSSDEIYKSIEKLNFLGSVLYVAAHPDDENTRMISYFSNELNARSAYLSLTRGDGGQNLIGPEIREQLGLIRTNELLKARSVDGGEQFFTRANDFGYSKNPDETQRIWNREDVLNDVVRIMRAYQPDIVINRFDAGSAGRTHGHHTTSAILSSEAFDLVGDKNYTVENSQPWQIKRMFFNTSWWFYGSREKFEEADKSKMMEVNIGTFYPELGLSNNEIAATSRSMHKSQGFGSTGTRGDESEYLQLING
ncbi:MAG: PIG-L family deacetylase, partial [Lutimonas sp.]